MIEAQFNALVELRARQKAPAPTKTQLSSGAMLVSIPGIELGEGWNRPTADVLFLVPPGYPAAQPDCFWVEPGNFRLANGSVGQSSNDGSAIPGDVVPNRSVTWFSWHLQSWNPNNDSLITYFNVVMARLKPAR